MLVKDAIREAMIRKGWTQYDLAKACNRGHSAVNTALNRECSHVRAKTIHQLCKALDLDPSVFLEKSSQVPSAT